MVHRFWNHSLHALWLLPGALPKQLRNALFACHVRLSVRMNNSHPTGRISVEVDVSIISKNCRPN